MNFARIFGMCLFVAAGALMWEVVDKTDLKIVEKFLSPTEKKQVAAKPPPPPEPIKVVDDRAQQRVPKSPEVVNQEVDLLCRDLNSKFDESKIEKHFARVDFKFHEKRLKTMKFNDRLKSCFRSVSTAKNRVEIDVFSADFKGENAADLIELQVSVFDKKSRNKIFEAGQSLDLSSTLSIPTKADANPAN